MVTIAQIMGVLPSLNIPWEGSDSSMFGSFGFMMGADNAVALECVLGPEAMVHY